MKKISAEIIADSIDTRGNRITTVLATFPRFILAEAKTHRIISGLHGEVEILEDISINSFREGSKNSASSRAIPFEKMVKMVEEDPFVPIAWQKDHKGMQGSEYIDVNKNNICYPPGDWLEARDCIVQIAKEMNADGVSKQIVNRMLEPFMWHTVLITATEWENFFNLRCPQYQYQNCSAEDSKVFKSKEDLMNYFKEDEIIYPKLETFSIIDWLKINNSQAEIHIQALAEAIWDAMNESTPKLLNPGEYHIPFGDKIESEKLANSIGFKTSDYDWYYKEMWSKIKIATARAARLSYMTFDGEIDYEKDIQLHDRLLKNKHASAFEHCCRVLTNEEYNILGKMTLHPEKGYIFEKGWVDNIRGFISYRRILNI